MNPASNYRYLLGTLVILASILSAPEATFGQTLISDPPTQPISSEAEGDNKASEKLDKLDTQRGGSHNFFKNLFRDQKAFLKSPLAIKRRDARWLAPLAGATAILIATDHGIASRIGESKDPIRHSGAISSLGSPYATFGTAGTIYALGALSRNERLRETGAMGFEALIDSAIVARALKLATGRQRPNRKSNETGFWNRGDSFPSGHAITTWALATVVAHQYDDQPFVKVAAYGVAAAVAVARVTRHSHYPSDTLVGASLGYLIGRYVVRAHGKSGSSKVPSISPYLNKATRTYGVGLSLPF